MITAEQVVEEVVIDLFEYFYTGLTNNKGFRLDLKMKKQEAVLNSFTKLLAKRYNIHSVTPRFLVDYFIYQFQYWYEKDINRNISFSWIVGKKAFQRWIEKDYAQSEYFNKIGILAKLNVTPTEIYARYTTPLVRVTTQCNKAEEIEKRRFYNTTRGLVNCLESTTLFTKSKICTLCMFREECKKLLLKNYPKLYEIRIGNGTNNG